MLRPPDKKFFLRGLIDKRNRFQTFWLYVLGTPLYPMTTQPLPTEDEIAEAEQPSLPLG
jgi:hypothetical protein